MRLRNLFDAFKIVASVGESERLTRFVGAFGNDGYVTCRPGVATLGPQAPARRYTILEHF